MKEKNIVKIIKALISSDAKVKVALTAAISAIVVAAIGTPIVINIYEPAHPSSSNSTSFSSSNIISNESFSNSGTENKPSSSSGSDPKVLEYEIALEANGGSVSKNEITVKLGGKYEGLSDSQREGYTFAGWFTSDKGGMLITKDSAVTVPVPKTLYAHWGTHISLNANGGSVYQSFVPVILGEKYVGLPIPQRNNYSFEGWYTSDVGGNKVTEGMQVVAPVPKTLYAHWNLNSPVPPALNINVPVRNFLRGNVSAVLSGSALTVIIDKYQVDQMNKDSTYPFKWGLYLTNSLEETQTNDYIIKLELWITSDGSVINTDSSVYVATSSKRMDLVQSDLTNVVARFDNGNYILSCDISNDYIRLEDICINTAYMY